MPVERMPLFSVGGYSFYDEGNSYRSKGLALKVWRIQVVGIARGNQAFGLAAQEVAEVEGAPIQGDYQQRVGERRGQGVKGKDNLGPV